jgi:hypothetical protein
LHGWLAPGFRPDATATDARTIDATMDKEYDVEVLYRQRVVYRVTAPDREAAERLAVERWQRGERTDLAGYDWCELQAVDAEESRDVKACEQDEELVLRFLRERERLLERLGADVLNPSANDAISAYQVASDLGWQRRSGPVGPDVLRAARVLERLCQRRLLICFERARVRTGERGGIRLYCTPEHLERLTSAVQGVEQEAV